MSKLLSGLFCIAIFLMCYDSLLAQSGKDAILKINHTEDFNVNGYGDAVNWSETEWIPLSRLRNKSERSNLSTKVKVLYSDTGIYFLFDCQDEVLSASMDSDFLELWREDVVEVFLWPDENQIVYFEYELSPLNYELPILVSNNKGKQSHWIPFEYSYKEDRKVRHETSVEGGDMESGASITKWRAEFFIPFELMRPLKNIFPESGIKWRANMYRIDYDEKSIQWAWQPVSKNFHEYNSFGTFIFE